MSKNYKSIFRSAKYLILISNELSEYSEKIKVNDPKLEVYSTLLKNLSSMTNNIKDVRRDDLLIVLKKEFINSEIKKEIHSFFKNKLDIIKPYILFFSERTFLQKEKIQIMKADNFYYQLSGITYIDIEIKNLYQYLAVVFTLMRENERLQQYISDSFSSIINEQVIKKQKEKIEKLYKELELLSKIDLLTKLLNRKAFYEALTRERKRALRDIWRLESINRPSGIPIPEQFKDFITDETETIPANTFLDHYGRFVCMMIDIDNFKKVNDTHGHLVGDMVLIKIGEVLNSKIALRENDVAGRFGGEEFIILLPETNSQNAKIPANRLRHYINKILFKSEKKTFHITVSIGISKFRIDDKNIDDVIKRADKALYYSKNNGRDMVTVYEDVFEM